MLRKLNILLLALLASQVAFALPNEAQLNYIEKYKFIAVKEMERSGIPASIKLAQGLLESAAGTSFLAKSANNHFGIKCGSNWNGKKAYREDDDYNANGELIKSCFRVYKNPEESFSAHSELLRDPRKEYRYGFLFRLDPTDYKSWAVGLKKAGYATSTTYDKKLITIIETYQLDRFDQMSSSGLMAENPEMNAEQNRRVSYEEAMQGVTMVNDIKMVLAKDGETPSSIAQRFGVKASTILDYNELIGDEDTQLEEGTRVFLQPKRNFFRGNKKWHYVKEGETMYDIAQLYGLKLDRLYVKNLMPENSQPAVGERIRLRGRTKDQAFAPQLRTEGEESKEEALVDLEEIIWPPEPPLPNTPPKNNLPPTNTPPPSSTKPTVDLPSPAIETPSSTEKEEDLLDEITPITTPNPKPKTEPTPPPVFEDPFKNKNTTTTKPETKPAAQGGPTVHLVIKGDTLYSLSRRYGISVNDIKSWNGLKDNTILPGQKLRVSQ